MVSFCCHLFPCESLPDTLSSLSLFEKTVSKSRIDEAFTESGRTQYDSSSLMCSVKCAASSISHDFTVERFLNLSFLLLIIFNFSVFIELLSCVLKILFSVR